MLDREDCNVVLVDWSHGAGFPYAQAAGNIRLVGAQVAELIRFLISSSSGSQILPSDSTLWDLALELKPQDMLGAI